MTCAKSIPGPERRYACPVKRALVTGMSGTGKSSVIRELAGRGFKAIDTDSDEWSAFVDADPPRPSGGPDWVWREDRIQRLLSVDDADVLFVSGCKTNQSKFYPQFDHIILLSAPVAVIVARLAARTNNPYGKDPDELAEVLTFVETVEPLLRRSASLEIDTSAPLADVVDGVIAHVHPGAAGS